MIEAVRILRGAHTVLVVDWPSKEVPETMARAGYAVTVNGGPGPEDYSVYECDGDDVIVRHVGIAPEHVDLVYAYRPMAELPGIVAMAQGLNAKAIWLQSGLSAAGVTDPTGCWVPEEASREARAVVEGAGMAYLNEPYIADAVRHLYDAG